MQDELSMQVIDQTAQATVAWVSKPRYYVRCWTCILQQELMDVRGSRDTAVVGSPTNQSEAVSQGSRWPATPDIFRLSTTTFL